MIAFITEDRQYHKKFKDHPTIKVFHYEDALSYILDFIDKNDDICLDIETNGLNAYNNQAILYGIGNSDFQFILHKPKIENCQEIFQKIKDDNKRVIGHNIKFDSSFIYTNEGVLFTNVYDTMIAEQRLWQKMDISHSYGAVVFHYLKEREEEVDKRIRTEFIGANAEYFKVEERHIMYLVSDLDKLLLIKAKQDKAIYKYDLHNLIYKIEMPLIPIVTKAEVTGFTFNFPKWKEVYEENIEIRFELEKSLDEEFRKLRDETVYNDSSTKLRAKGGKYDHKRVKSKLLDYFDIDGTPKGIDLFGNPLNSKQVTGIKKKVDFYPNNINYNSSTQVMEIFAHLQEPLHTKFGDYVIPDFNTKGKIDKRHYSFETNKDSFEKYLLDYPKSRMKTFINNLVLIGKYSTLINNFGINYKSKINPITGKLHTDFRQCMAVTGRFQSGGGKKQPDKPNFQNIPGDNRLRNCFEASKGYSIITADYSGAELIVMCSLSQDMHLLEMSKGDMHSKIATKCWKQVYKYRAKEAEKKLLSKNSTISHQELKEIYDKNINLYKTFEVNKDTPEGSAMRTKFKPVTFGVIYGLRDKGLADNLSISVEEARIIIKVLKDTFPKVFAMVEASADFALHNGYIILNHRTKSRAYFPNIIKYLKGEYNMKDNFKEIMADVNEARNIRIQGTQADFIKEASVNIQKYIDKHNIDATILSWVHDEIITECEEKYDGKSKAYNTWKQLNPKELCYTNFKGIKNEGLNFPQIKELIMNDTANQYLKNVTIKTEYDVEKHWLKD